MQEGECEGSSVLQVSPLFRSSLELARSSCRWEAVALGPVGGIGERYESVEKESQRWATILNERDFSLTSSRRAFSTDTSLSLSSSPRLFPRKAAAALHPGAMYRLGTAELNGNLGLSKRPKEGVKWLKRSTEHATEEFPHALHELALLHERGIDNVLFIDLEYAAELLAQASELGYAPSAYKLGECYEYGKMGCPQDAALSIHYYVSSSFFHVFPYSISSLS